MFAKLAQSLAVLGVQLVKQFPAAPVGERLEHLIHFPRNYMQPIGCMSMAKKILRGWHRRPMWNVVPSWSPAHRSLSDQ